jgi:murein DD-endopeptidase MepM/ murein hydrolase activator NlpD
MSSPRYTILIANRKNGGGPSRLTVSRRVAGFVLTSIVAVPLVLGLGTSGVDVAQVEVLKTANESLMQENQSYREATGELTTQIASLQTALTELGEQAQLDPATRVALEKLARVRPLSIGGPTTADLKVAQTAAATTPEGTFGILRGLLGALETRLESSKRRLKGSRRLRARRHRFGRWSDRWTYTSAYGNRKDPFTGETAFHPGLDIAADQGVPVHATADGTVETAAYDGNYGKAVVLSHGFSISTRYGPLSQFAVKPGQKIKRGDVIGYVGATGRVTGAHLHYEILISGTRISPLTILGR